MSDPIATPAAAVLVPLNDAEYGGATGFKPLELARAEFERSYLKIVWDASGNHVARAAELAGVTRQAMYMMLDRHGIRSKASQ